MSENKNVYVVLRRSGRVMRLGNGMGESTESEGPFLWILDRIATELNSSGGFYDAPYRLFLNGKCVVESGLDDLAYRYNADKVAAAAAAQREIQNIHMPDWLPENERKPGYNPPGVDAWTVRKAGR